MYVVPLINFTPSGWWLLTPLVILTLLALVTWRHGLIELKKEAADCNRPLAHPSQLTKGLPPYHVVYFTGINSANPAWQQLIRTQLTEMVEFGIAEAAQSILVVFSSSSNGLVDGTREELLELVNQLAMLILPHRNVMTFLHSGNQYEYPGIWRVWDVARSCLPNCSASEDNSVILYFHGKGMFNGGDTRSDYNIGLTYSVVKPWCKILGWFATHPQLNKGGFCPSSSG